MHKETKTFLLDEPVSDEEIQAVIKVTSFEANNAWKQIDELLERGNRRYTRKKNVVIHGGSTIRH